MKLKALFAILLVLILCTGSALADARHDELVHSIYQDMSWGKYPHDMYSHYIDTCGYSYEEWYAAAVDAINMAKASGGQKRGTFGFESRPASFYDELLAEAAKVVGASAELGDSTANTALLTGIAAVSAAGLSLARKKRASC